MTTEEKRPRSVTITLLGVMLFGSWNAAKAFSLAQQLSLLLALDIRPDPRLLLVIAISWAVLFWASAIALWRRRSLTRWLIPLLLLLYALYELVLQGLFVPIPISGQSWLLRFLWFDTVILFALWSLNRSKVKSYFVASQPASMAEKRK